MNIGTAVGICLVLVIFVVIVVTLNCHDLGPLGVWCK